MSISVELSHHVHLLLLLSFLFFCLTIIFVAFGGDVATLSIIRLRGGDAGGERPLWSRRRSIPTSALILHVSKLDTIFTLLLTPVFFGSFRLQSFVSLGFFENILLEFLLTALYLRSLLFNVLDLLGTLLLH